MGGGGGYVGGRGLFECACLAASLRLAASEACVRAFPRARVFVRFCSYDLVRISDARVCVNVSIGMRVQCL